MRTKIKIVGCGLSGITAANILKNKGYDVKIYDTRSHIGGNCYDGYLCGTLTHQYGPHIFHTNDENVFSFLSEFTDWFPFEYKPKGKTKLGLISLPYSKKTIKEIGRELSLDEIKEIIFKDYSEKQWGIAFEKLPKSICNRIPNTSELDDPTWYKDEKYQCMPKYGYTKMFEEMLRGINIELACDKYEWKKDKADLTIYTGSIDSYFNYCYGFLPYRSLEFEHKVTNKKMNYVVENQNTKDVAYTRKYDHSFFNFKHNQNTTVITKEFPLEYDTNNIPYYPKCFGKNKDLYLKYRKLANQENNVLFLGRLANYKYLDMWCAIKLILNKLK